MRRSCPLIGMKSRCPSRTLDSFWGLHGNLPIFCGLTCASPSPLLPIPCTYRSAVHYPSVTLLLFLFLGGCSDILTYLWALVPYPQRLPVSTLLRDCRWDGSPSARPRRFRFDQR